MARPNPLADPEYAQQVAELVAEGSTRKDVAEAFGVKDLDTITRWKRDIRVKSRVEKIIRDRAIEVSTKVDAQIQQRLQNPENLTTKDLLDIRKEFVGERARAKLDRADDETITQAAEALERDPELAAKIQRLVQAAEAGEVEEAPTNAAELEDFDPEEPDGPASRAEHNHPGYP